MKQVIVGITGNIKEMPAMSGMYFDAVSRHLSDGVKVAGGFQLSFLWEHQTLLKPISV